ncbi:MAG: glycosyltransferase [Chitinivibrionales bacterium]|nr:glycosyltransferase [Chitinivibrionales bacterium]
MLSMQENLELFTAQSGQLSAKVKTDETSYRHLHSLVKPEDEHVHFGDIEFWGDIIIFAGIGLGYHITDKIDRLPSSTKIIIIDYYETCIEHCRKALFSERQDSIVTVSETSEHDSVSSLQSASVHWAGKKIQVIKHPASYAVHREFYERVLSNVFSFEKRSSPAPQRKSEGMLLYGKFFLQEELRRAQEQVNGPPPALFLYEQLSGGITYESALQKQIQEQRPDYILSVNMKGFDGSGVLPWYAQTLGMPIVVWFVDDPHPILLHQKQFVNKSMIAFCWEKAYLPYLKSCGFDSVHCLPLAADPSLFSEHSPAEPRVDLGFVGSAMGREFLDTIKSRFMWNDALSPLVDMLSNKLLEQPGLPVRHVIDELTENKVVTLPFSDERNLTWLSSCIIHTASMKKRKAIIGSLQDRGIETFGDPHGWRELLGPSLKTHPDIDYTTQLCQTYREIAVNTNITSCQMPTAVNQRVFDIPLSGSFVLSDKQEQLAELFEIGTEAIWYESIEDLKEKINHYKTASDQRKAISAAARKRILAEHTYEKRVGEIVKRVKS